MKNLLGTIFLLLCTTLIWAQETTVTGKVTSAEDGMPIPGVSVVVKGSTNGTITTIDGEFSLNANMGETLLFSFIGMQAQEHIIDGTTLNVTLQTEVSDLDEVVVVGYGVQKKSAVTGAISSIKSEDIQKMPIQRAEQAIQGQVAGVQVAANSGQPGAGISVNIRGVGTTGDSQPLFIVDGNPVGDISYLASTDIGSMEVLKDASASAIYGARGANGVVIITTKKGSEGAAKLTYDGYYGVQNAWRNMDLLDAREYQMIINESLLNSGYDSSSKNWIQDSEVAGIGAGTDWQKEIFRDNAPIQSHTLTLSGGNQKVVYSSALSYFEQEGIVSEDKSSYERINFRANADYTSYDDKLKIGSSMLYSRFKSQGVDPNSVYNSPLAQAINIDPITSVRDEDGTFSWPIRNMQEIVNPVANMYYLHDEYRTDKIVGNLYAEYEFLKDLKVRSSLGIDYAYQWQDTYKPLYELSEITNNTSTKVDKNMKNWYTYNWETTLNYHKVFGAHEVDALAGTTLMTSTYENLSGSASDLLIEGVDYAYIDNSGNDESKTASGGFEENALRSYFGRVNYSYGDKYMASLTVRHDGSSRFGSNNRYATFPSISTGWIISEESFLKDKLGPVSFLKIRASWGQNGNENIGNFAYLSLITNNNEYNFNDGLTVKGSAPEKIANPDLKWETSEQTDIGFDLRVGSKFSLNFDYYNKVTKDLLIDAAIPGYIGNDAPTVNGGTVENKGVELLLGYRDQINDFSYGATLNLSANKNEMTKINNEEGIMYGDVSVGPSGMEQLTIAKVGEPIGFFWGYETAGVFQNEAEVNAHSKDGVLIQENAQPGDLIYVDQNDDGVLDNSDRINLGDPYPDFTVGLNLNMAYKNIDFSMFWYGVVGNQMINATRRYDLPNVNYQTSILNRWTGEGTSNSEPRVVWNDVNNNQGTFSDYMVEDADYLRLKNIQLGFTLPKSVLDKVNIERIRLYVSGDNLLTFTKYSGFEPEIGNSDNVFYTGVDQGIYPQARVVSIGANITF
ncbi:SusC/RagA family TonB-linked outer membrane protein [Saccharicrinis fermentans]|uniref:Outer membrane cobalamin receptor protein n=1 Tax=Saccharicrinis fermentans DSM 9555 = JCM 21142 TaxID=869213 RepID=W7Y9L4_9BACT|nr:TonB-dependent receptor [Saccharicrinis fermentans]GAF04193.1 outer membrane cobalamin receptor protein [Saccharicrinis fermentans DSM 9555 = JCM 21142]